MSKSNGHKVNGANLRRLSQTELLRLVNHASPDPGFVFTRARLRSQMDRAAYLVGDGRMIDLVRYAQWLHGQREPVPARPATYEERADETAGRRRRATKRSQDIGPIPDVADLGRRRRGLASLRVFCETYFEPIFFLPWSKDHLRAIRRLERAIKRGGLFAFAMPRGSGKTCLLRIAGLWAILAGYRPFVCLIAGNEGKAKKLLGDTRKVILENHLLAGDFPEALYPLRRLDNSSKRQRGQHVGGRLTLVQWGDTELVFPTLDTDALPAKLRDAGMKIAPSCGAAIAVTSLDAQLRGPQHQRADGTVIRPSLVLLDDPQTRRSARSAILTDYRMHLLAGDVLGMAGPGVRISALVACTKIYEGDLADRLLDREIHPEWQGECTKLVYAFPRKAKLWDRYAEIRADGQRRGDDGRAATVFYREHREAMDEGARLAWPERYDSKTEISGVQHAWNLRLDYGDDAFFAEFQNEPRGDQIDDGRLTPEQVIAKTNGRPRSQVPIECPYLTGFIDVHNRLLYYIVAAWQEDFTGYVIEYGTFPKQGRGIFAARSAQQTLQRRFTGTGINAAIHAGLSHLVADLLGRDFRRAGGGGLVRIGRLLVDMGHKPSIVAAVKYATGAEAMILSRGVGITAARKPMAQYKRKRGERYGHNWYTPQVHGSRDFPHVAFDTNYWKSYIHGALLTPAGDKADLTLYGGRTTAHELFAEHLAGSERPVETFGQGRIVHEWNLPPSQPDNHWFDCLVGCAVAASMLGAKTEAEKGADQRPRKRYTQADLSRRR